MSVLADRCTLRHCGDHIAAEVLRVRAREADPLDALDSVDGAQELGKARADVAAVRVDVLAEQRHLPDALGGEPFDLGDDLAGTAGRLAPAYRGDDAVGADRVAAHRDLDPRLETPLAPDRKSCGERTLLSGSEGAARDALAAGAEPVTEVRDRSWPERDVDGRKESEQPLALGLGIATADGDNGAGVFALVLRRISHVRSEARVRLLADCAGVEDDHVCLLL